MNVVDGAPALTVVYYFLAFLGISVLQRAVGHVLLGSEADEGLADRQVLWLTIACETIDSILALAAIWCTARPPVMPRSARQRALGWLAGLPLLLAALAVNRAYHGLLRDYVALPRWFTAEDLLFAAPLHWQILTICVQPAIFEELFFRYLLLGHLRGVMGVHAAVWVSSLAFGLAHLGAPLSMPILIVVGVALGYARVWSGSLLLPMLMHAAHNGVVIYLRTNI